MQNRHTAVLPSLACVALPLLCAPALAEEGGFFEDSRTDLVLRNYAFNRDFRDHSAGKSLINEWAQGFILKFSSGYTRGPLGFGVDAMGLYGVKLNSKSSSSATTAVAGVDGRGNHGPGAPAVVVVKRKSASEDNGNKRLRAQA